MIESIVLGVVRVVRFSYFVALFSVLLFLFGILFL